MVLASLALLAFQTKLTPIARIQAEMIDECSGIAKSRKYKDTYWVHNDSGDIARIFAIHSNGELIQPHQDKYEGIKLEHSLNYDWEDIAIDGDTLYASDCGDNKNGRTDQTVYMFKEPDPSKATTVSDAKKIRIAYPDKTPTGPWHFDCESLGVWKGTLYFVTKWRRERTNMPDVGASIYSLSNPSFDKVNTLKKLDTKLDLGGWATACDISADGKKIAVLTQFPTQSVWLFDMTKGSNIFHHPIKQIVFTNANQCEAVCWESPTSLIITNEQRDIFRLKI